MRRTVGLLLILAAALRTPHAGAPLAATFHPDGGGTCGCHTLHQSENNVPVPASGMLLRGLSATDLCLSCHASANGAVLGSSPSMPPPEIGAGNFTFLLAASINDAAGGAGGVIRGEHAGHTIVSAAAGTVEDSDRPTAPGGIFSSRDLGCTSCHDPHGGGNYRMLWGAGAVQGGLFNFSYPAPEADGVSLSAVESPSAHTAYRGGWARWCANCHGLYHEQGSTSFAHPVDRTLGVSAIDSYNRYRGEADPNGGDTATSYLPEVPFEEPLRTTADRSGPTGSARIMCMSCHRAHATSAPAAARWDNRVLFLDRDGVESGSWPIPNPYPGATQRALCVKCHLEETRSHGDAAPCLSCHGQATN